VNPWLNPRFGVLRFGLCTVLTRYYVQITLQIASVLGYNEYLGKTIFSTFLTQLKPNFSSAFSSNLNLEEVLVLHMKSEKLDN
jgi:hypothetical protein